MSQNDMPNDLDESLDSYAAVGPLDDMYGHKAVTTIDASLMVCLHCGYTTKYYKVLQAKECDPSKNTINTTWAESIAEDGFPQPED